tara:strand:- start:440 stop:1066 length:627 start_codon:yes stop_codon:yes gene_type:complete
MPTKKTKSKIADIFEQLNELNVNEFTKKKGNFTYLSWAWAVREFLKVAPDATWHIHEWGIEGNKQPYMQTEAGCFVQVTVTVPTGEGEPVSRTQVHPVLDNRNQPIEKPNAFHINTSIQRCLAKAISLHGLGLYIYAGEDLPVDDPLTSDEIKDMLNLANETGDDSKVTSISDMIDSGQINRSNYAASKAKLERLVKEKKNEASTKSK